MSSGTGPVFNDDLRCASIVSYNPLILEWIEWCKQNNIQYHHDIVKHTKYQYTTYIGHLYIDNLEDWVLFKLTWF